MTTTATAAHRPQPRPGHTRSQPPASCWPRPQREGASSAVLMSATGWQALRCAVPGPERSNGVGCFSPPRSAAAAAAIAAGVHGERVDRAGSRGPRRP